MSETQQLDLDTLLRAYAIGWFPMADSRDAAGVHWVQPKERAIMPLDGFHLAKSLRKTLTSERYTTTADRAFDAVLDLCAEGADNRPDTWINPGIADAMRRLHRLGLAHSIETWEEEQLVGGLYGLALGRAFFGESMVSRATDASKVALAHLVARMRVGISPCSTASSRRRIWPAWGLWKSARPPIANCSTGHCRGPRVRLARQGPLRYRRPISAPSTRRPDAPPGAASVSGPTSGWRITQALVQTSQTGCSTVLSDGDSLNSQPEK